MLDIIIHTLRNVHRKKLKSTLTIVAISIGVASMILIASIGDIGKSIINGELESMGIDGIAISIDKKKSTGKLTQEMLDVITQNTYVNAATPLMMEVTQSKMRGMVGEVMVWGVDKGAKQIVSLKPIYGRMLSDADVASGEPVCVVDENLANIFYKRSNIVGKTVDIQLGGQSVPFTIIGVVSTGGNIVQNILGEYVPAFAYIPYTTMQNLTGTTGFDQIAVKVKNLDQMDIASKTIVDELEHNIDSSLVYKSENLSKQRDALNHILGIITFVLSLIAGVSMVVAGLGIMTVMLNSVREKTREIGIKKAIGASRALILFEFLMEAFTLALFGSLLGCAGGALLVVGGCFWLHQPVTLSLRLMAIAISIAFAVSIIFSVYPAKLAASLRPVDALWKE